MTNPRGHGRRRTSTSEEKQKLGFIALANYAASGLVMPGDRLYFKIRERVYARQWEHEEPRRIPGRGGGRQYGVAPD